MDDEVPKQLLDPSHSGEIKFGLSTMFYLLAVYAFGLAFGAGSIVLTTSILAAWWWVANKKIAMLIAVFFFVAVVIWFVTLGAPASRVRSTPFSTFSLNNTRQIMLAIFKYEADHQSLPPAQKNEEGKPPCSWRVLMLPSLEQSDLYDQYDFDEPWDGPNNIKLLDQMPFVYARTFENMESNSTPYKLVVDTGTVFQEGQQNSWKDMLDGPSGTIGLVSDTSNPVPWTKPEDLSVEQTVAVLCNPDHDMLTEQYFSTHFKTVFHGVLVGMMDGSTHFVVPKADPEKVRAGCLCADGKTIDVEKLPSRIVVDRWDRYFILGTYIILLLLPGILLLRKHIR